VVSYALIELERGRITIQKSGTTNESLKGGSTMKGNISKLSVLVGVPAMALLIMVVMASAGPAIPYGIKGVYAVTGFSSCNPAGLGIMEADYTFSNDGSGSATGVVRNIEPAVFPEGGSALTITFNFTYTVTKQGRIEFTYPSGGIKVGFTDAQGVYTYLMTWDGGPSHGVISPDDKAITISCGPPVFLTVAETSAFGPPLGMKTYCVTTAVGIRIK
jgi:hypothetical protein